MNKSLKAKNLPLFSIIDLDQLRREKHLEGTEVTDFFTARDGKVYLLMEFGHLYGKREGISPEALMEECLHDVEQAAYHPHKALNQAIAQHLMQGDLQENLDRL